MMLICHRLIMEPPVEIAWLRRRPPQRIPYSLLPPLLLQNLAARGKGPLEHWERERQMRQSNKTRKRVPPDDRRLYSISHHQSLQGVPAGTSTKRCCPGTKAVRSVGAPALKANTRSTAARRVCTTTPDNTFPSRPPPPPPPPHRHHHLRQRHGNLRSHRGGSAHIILQRRKKTPSWKRMWARRKKTPSWKRIRARLILENLCQRE